MKVTNQQQILDLLKENREKLGKLGVNRIGVFGSFVMGEQKKSSDVDLVVEFNKGQKNFRNFIGTANFTEDLLGRKVDLLTPQSLSPYIAPHIEKVIEYVQIS
ncbi:nucleotidyltransferase family protein [Candidatus Curtissbacteria bacterium]|nr:nucleotidyltransferase family protein [Candidatus Curtissbacteria bacterium]